MNGFHHLRKRARVTRGLEPFPARTTWKRMLDYFMYAVGLLAPLALLPQIIQIYSTKTSGGVSLTTWVLLTIVNVLWTIYAAAHKDKQLFFASILLFFFDIAIVVGLLTYG